jgi:hypothetical protein
MKNAATFITGKDNLSGGSAANWCSSCFVAGETRSPTRPNRLMEIEFSISCTICEVGKTTAEVTSGELHVRNCELVDADWFRSFEKFEFSDIKKN